ncbi:MAG: hypothetical protein R3D46_04880 [Defluviimonas denitrificans]
MVFTDIGNEGSALMLNDPYLRPGKPVFLWDTGTLDMAALKATFPGARDPALHAGLVAGSVRPGPSGDACPRT